MRERIAIVFMTVSAIATLVLGGTLVAQLGKTEQTTKVISGSGAPAAGNASSVTTTTAGGSSAAQGGGATGGSSNAGSGTSSGGGATASTQPGGGAEAAGGGGGQTAAGSSPSNPSEGVTDSVIKVGGIYDETGPLDATVERDVVRSYFNKVNAEGGVAGRKLQLVDCDSAYDPSRAHQCSQRLISQHILAVVGWLSVSGEQPETPYLTKQGIPIIGGLAVPAEFESPLSFPTMASLVRHGTAMGNHAADLDIKKPGLVLLNANFIKPVEQSLLDALHKNGIQETSVNEVDATKADYTDIAVKLRSEGADSVIAGLDPFSYLRMFQAFQRQNYDPVILGLGLDKTNATKQYADAAYGAESLTPFLEKDDHPNDAGVQEYLDTVKHYFPSQYDALDVYTAGAWTAAKVFVQALRQLGNQPITRQSLADSLNRIHEFQPGLTVPLTYKPGPHDPNHCFQWIRDKQGTWTTYSGWKCF